MRTNQFIPFENFILGSVEKPKSNVLKGGKEDMDEVASNTYLVVEKVGEFANNSTEPHTEIKVGDALKIGQVPMWLKFADRPNFMFVLFTRHDIIGHVTMDAKERKRRLDFISGDLADEVTEKVVTAEQARAALLQGVVPVAKEEKSSTIYNPEDPQQGSGDIILE